MNERFVVDSFVGLRALRVAVEDQHLAEDGGPDDPDVLELRTARIIDAGHGVVVLLGRSEFLNVPLPIFSFRHGLQIRTAVYAVR